MSLRFSAALRALYLSSALAGLALGLFNPLIAAHLDAHGLGELAVGANGSLFFLFTIVAAPLAGQLIRRIGVRSVQAGGIALTAVAAALFPWFDSLLAWSLLRALMGLGLGLYMVSGQTALNGLADERTRASINGLYALAFGAGLGIGPLAGAWLYGIAPTLAFGTGAGLLLLGLVPVLGYVPALRGSGGGADLKLLARLSLPLHAVFAYGVAEATLMSLYPVFLLQRGYGLREMSLAFSAFVVGSLLATLPVTLWADRHGRERVLAACALIGVLALGALAHLPSVWLVTAVSVLAGASLGPVFALSLSLVGDRVTRAELPAGSALFTAAFSFGCLVAPLLSALLMRAFGGQHLFALSLLLFAVLLLRLLASRDGVWAGAGA